MRTYIAHAMLLTTVLFLTSLSAVAAEDQPTAQTATGIMEQIDQDLRSLRANLARLDHQLSMPEAPTVSDDPTISALRQLHRAGWELHRKQWVQQQVHLQFAREHLRQAHANPEDHATLRQQWRTHEQEFEAAMRRLRREREALEEKQLQFEAELVDRHFR
jgi:predicted  nucleic acid-binding Zn-ribbon protein